MLIYMVLALAVLIIVVLSVIALRLVFKVRLFESQKAELLAQKIQMHREQETYIVESLRVISLNVLSKDLNLSEATIRCKVLLDGLYLSSDVRKPYAILETVYLLIKDFDTHKARGALTDKVRQKQDADRELIEGEYQQQLLDCFTLLKDFSLESLH